MTEPKFEEDPTGASRTEAGVWDPEEFLSRLTSYHDNPHLTVYRSTIHRLRNEFNNFGDQYARHWQTNLPIRFLLSWILDPMAPDRRRDRSVEDDKS